MNLNVNLLYPNMSNLHIKRATSIQFLVMNSIFDLNCLQLPNKLQASDAPFLRIMHQTSEKLVK